MQLSVTEVEPSRENRLVAEMDIVVVAPENEPLLTPFWILDDFVLECAFEDIVEFNGLGLSSFVCLSPLCRIIMILALFGCFSNVSFSLSPEVSAQCQAADLA
jgi:hypothetical protein